MHPKIPLVIATSRVHRCHPWKCCKGVCREPHIPLPLPSLHAQPVASRFLHLIAPVALDQSAALKGSNEKKKQNPKPQRSPEQRQVQQQSPRGDLAQPRVALAGHGGGRPAPWDGDTPWPPPGDAPTEWLGHVASFSLSPLDVAAGGQGVLGTPRGAGGGVRVRAGLPPRRRAGAYFLVGTIGIKLEVG